MAAVELLSKAVVLMKSDGGIDFIVRRLVDELQQQAQSTNREADGEQDEMPIKDSVTVDSVSHVSTAVPVTDDDECEQRLNQSKFAFLLQNHVRWRTYGVHIREKSQSSSGLTPRKNFDVKAATISCDKQQQQPVNQLKFTKRCTVEPTSGRERSFHGKLAFAGSGDSRRSAPRSNKKFCFGQYLPVEEAGMPIRRSGMRWTGTRKGSSAAPSPITSAMDFSDDFNFNELTLPAVRSNEVFFIGATLSTNIRKQGAPPMTPALDFSDEAAFPPVGSMPTTKGTRRINPTRIESNADASCGNANPSFDAKSVAVPVGGARELDEERQLLRLERARGVITNRRSLTDESATPPTCDRPIPSQTSPFTNSTSRIAELSPAQVTHKDELNVLADLYAACMSENLLCSVAFELHFLVQLITIQGVQRNCQIDKNTSRPTGTSLENPANCIYFAIGVLWRQKQLLTYLDTLTLRLLCENSRVKSFSSDLQAFAAETASVAGNLELQGDVSTLPRPIGSVAFHSETDVQSKFITEQGFHMFRKKRDSFYEVLREWQANHVHPNWSFDSAGGVRIRALVAAGTNDPSTYAHLARLFLSQLVSMCVWEGAVDEENTDTEPDQLEALKKTDPQKYRRLSNRFVTPSYFGGPCPPPSFPGSQEFFSRFIIIAASHDFNQYLINSFASKLDSLKAVQLNSIDCDVGNALSVDAGSSEAREIFFTSLLTFRLVAKFLGFLAFLPYQTKEELTDDVLQEQVALRNAVFPVLDVSAILIDAIRYRRIVLVVPVLIEYLSMMDPIAPNLGHYRCALNLLHHLGRSKHLAIEDHTNGNRLLVLATLGWLFKVIAGYSVPPFESVVDIDFGDVVLDSDREALDTMPLVDKRILYTCCPYLAEIRVVLSEFARGVSGQCGGFKKITPFTPDAYAAFSSSKIRHLQLQLEENFFHNQPVSLHRTVEFVSDRISSNVIKHVRRVVLPSIRNEASAKVQRIASGVVRDSVASSSTAEPPGLDSLSSEVKLNAVAEVKSIARKSDAQARAVTLQFTDKFCFERTLSTFKILLPDDTDMRVIDMCARIARRNIIKKVSQWFVTQAVADIYYKELISELRKELKTMDKEKISTVSSSSGDHVQCIVSTELSPSRVLLEVKNSFKLLYDMSKPLPFTLADVLAAIKALQSLLSAETDVSTCKTYIQLSVDFAVGLSMAIVVRRPDFFTDAIDSFVGLFRLHSELSKECVSSIMCPRNVRHLTVSVNEQESWASMQALLVGCRKAKILSATSLEAGISFTVQNFTWPTVCLTRLEGIRTMRF